MASSSSPQPETVKDDILMDRNKSVAPPKLYDVFINHRGPDVKETLAYDLYDCLQKRGCRAFLDAEEMVMGDSIPSTIRSAICSSSVQIAVFSKRYAESPWCLAELTLMLETNAKFKAKFIPLFYGVEPWELRHVKEGKGVYAEAFARFESLGRYPNNLHMWKTALSNASYFFGYELKTNFHKDDPKFSELLSVVEQEVEGRKPLLVSEYTVGLKELVADFEAKCRQKGEKENARIVGIFGMGGSGKTTLAKELFNRERSKYSRSCFVWDVRESSSKGELVSLQKQIIEKLFNESPPNFKSIDEGKPYLRNCLERSGNSSCLIILDDIDDQIQIDALLCMDVLSSGSLVIITTRDQRVLIRAGITSCYDLKQMDRPNATELFCWHAFRRPNPVKGFEDLVGRFVQLCQGLPLSLRVFGGHVFGSSDKQYWQWELEKVEKVLPQDLKQRLKISFDALDREESQIFLDIACFFIGRPKSMAIRIWKGSGMSAELAVQTLKDKCLIEVGYEVGYAYGDLVLRMHDHLRDMGREIADLSHPRRLWHPKFLKSLESMGFRKTLAKINGPCFHSFFDQYIHCKITFFLGETNADAGRLTALLWLELDLKESQLRSIPSWIPLQWLQFLKIVNGHLKRLWLCNKNNAQVPIELKELFLEKEVLEKFPHNLGNLIYLENLDLKGRYSDISSSKLPNNGMQIEGRSFSESLRNLSNLKTLVMWDLFLKGELDLTNGEDADAANFRFSSARGMSDLQTIHIRCVRLIYKISICGETCPRLVSLRLDSMENLAGLHFRKVTTLNYLHIRFCKKLKTVSGNFDMGDLKSMTIKECGELEEIPNLSCLTSLERIRIDQCQNLHSINGIEDLEGLQYLYLSTGDEGGGVWSCIQRLKRFPSEFSILIGKAVDGAESTLNSSFFSGLVSPDAVTELYPASRKSERKASVNMPDTLTAIIICALVESSDRGEIKTPISIQRSLAPGKRIVTMVLTGQKEVYRRHSPDFSLSLFHAELKKKFVVTLNGEEESKGLNIFNKIIAELYKGIS